MENKSYLQRIIDVFMTPSRAFEGMVEAFSYRDWLYPLIIVSMGIMILPLFYRDISFSEADQRLKNAERSVAANPDIPEERLEAIQERLDKTRSKIADSKENPFAFRNLWGYVLIPVMLFVMAAVFSAILLLIGNFGMGGKVKFFHMLTVVMTSYLIGGNGFFMNMIPGVGTLELLVKTPLIVMRDATDLLLSPGLMFSEIDSFLKQFLNHLDIFRIWGVAVMGFGFATLYGKSSATGIITVSLPWLILVAIGAALMQANNVVLG